MKTKLLSVLMWVLMFYSCNPEHKETIEPEKPSVENPEEPDYPDEHKIP